MGIEEKTKHLICFISRQVKSYNSDNVSRTKAYQNFYLEFPEIKWALVASIVSRNAGWNMTDLFLNPFKNVLSHKDRRKLFMTYERANWLIFSDAFPQLLLYKISRQLNKPLFHLLSDFHVSDFMINEWSTFWKENDKNRLMTALIINEQNVIHKPVIKQSYFKYHVFLRLPYMIQDRLFLNAVIIPIMPAELFGVRVHGFTGLTNRITIGKRVASILFNPSVYDGVLQFATSVEHTGSRRDYERMLGGSFEKTPLLRTVYPVITHQDIIRKDWYKKGGINRKWWEPEQVDSEFDISASFYKRRKMLYTYNHLRKWF